MKNITCIRLKGINLKEERPGSIKEKHGVANDEISASCQIDKIIASFNEWRGQILSDLRTIIRNADPSIIEEVKWKKPSNPAGDPVWSAGGIICIANVLKKSVRLAFPKGAAIKDEQKIFNSRMDSRTVRAVDYYENSKIYPAVLASIVKQAVILTHRNKVSE